MRATSNVTSTPTKTWPLCCVGRCSRLRREQLLPLTREQADAVGQPTAHFLKDGRQVEGWQVGTQRFHDAHNHAAALGAAGALVGPARLAVHGRIAQVTLHRIVGRRHVRQQHKGEQFFGQRQPEQLLGKVSKIAFVRLHIGNCRIHNGTAQRAKPTLQLDHSLPTSVVAESPVGGGALGIAVQLQELIEKPLIGFLAWVQQRQANRFAQQVSPTLLPTLKTVAVDRSIVTDTHTIEKVGRQDLVERGVVLVAAEQKHPLQLRRERPQRTPLVAHLPTRLIHGYDGSAGNQSAQQIKFVLPVPRQLPQQGVRLRFGQRQLTKESQHGTSLVQRNADAVHQKCQHHQDFDAVFTTRRHAGNGWLGATRAGKNAITHQAGAAVFQSPHGALTHQLTIGVPHASRIDILVALRVGKLHLARPPARGFLLLAASLAVLSPLGFRIHAVGSGRGRRTRTRAVTLLPHLGLVLCQPLRQAVDRGLQPLDGLLLRSKRCFQFGEPRFKASDDGIAFAASGAAGYVHTDSVGTRPARSCAKFSLLGQAPSRPHARGPTMDGYERDGYDFSLIPEEQESVEDWIDGLESLNQEGVDWVRYPLELRMGEDHARLVIRSIAVAEAEGSELVLKVGC